MKQTVPWTRTAAQRVGQGRRADEFEGGVHAVRVRCARTWRGDVPVVEERVVDAVLGERARRSACRVVASTVAPQSLGQDGGGQADRGGAAADQQRLAGLQVQAGGQRAVGGLQHLRQCAEDLPGQVGA